MELVRQLLVQRQLVYMWSVLVRAAWRRVHSVPCLRSDTVLVRAGMRLVPSVSCALGGTWFVRAVMRRGLSVCRRGG